MHSALRLSVEGMLDDMTELHAQFIIFPVLFLIFMYVYIYIFYSIYIPYSTFFFFFDKKIEVILHL